MLGGVLLDVGVLAQLGSRDADLADAVGSSLTAEDWAVAGATVVGFIVVARILRLVVERLVGRTDEEGDVSAAAGRIIQNVLVLVGVVYALNVLDVQIGPLVGALGIGGVAIAFAATAILQNVFASVLLKTRRPMRTGDEVTTNDQTGTVLEINFRTVILRNFDGEMVIIPSSKVTDEVIVNHTRHRRRRTVLVLGISYGADLALAQATILQAVRKVDGVLPTPAPQAWVTTFNESSIDFDVRFWHAPDIATQFRVRSDVAMAVKAALDEAGIEIPYPQRVVTLAADERE